MYGPGIKVYMRRLRRSTIVYGAGTYSLYYYSRRKQTVLWAVGIIVHGMFLGIKQNWQSWAFVACGSAVQFKKIMTNLATKITYFWARPIETINPTSGQFHSRENANNIFFSIT